jgi:hypothetical protein
MNEFIPDPSNDVYILNCVLGIKFLKIAHSDNDVNGQCLNSPYYVKYDGKLYKAECWSHSPTGNRLISLNLGIIRHVPMSEIE